MERSKAVITIIFLIISEVSCEFNVLTHNVSYGEDFTSTINKSVEFILEFKPKEKLNLPPRVTVSSSNAAMSAPLMIVTRQPKQMLSWQLPLTIDDDTTNNVIFDKTSRTLCHDENSKGISITGDEYYNPIVTLATVSETNVNFTVKVEYETKFVIEPSVTYNISISPSTPRYFYYSFPSNISKTTKKRDSNYDTVILKVQSEDDVCMTVSIQNVTCPVFDTNADVTFRGFYETVNRQGGITIPKYKFPHGFYAVFVAKADNSDCDLTSTKANYVPKNFTLIVKPSISYDDYVNAVLATLGSIVAFFIAFGFALCYCTTRGYVPRQMAYVDEAETPTCSAADVIGDNQSVDENEYDRIVQVDSDRTLCYCKPELFLSDLAKKDPQVLRYKSQLYLYNVLTVALFYGLPVVQLVVTYQKVLNQTGQQDLCYYNFLCAHPVGVISDFNHVFSNIGYILLGLLFLWITYRREITHKDPNFERHYGIPQHYGMFYAMGVALIMEGVLSGSYHVCPNQANFQFDSSFMYVMAVLCIVKLYQNRHPDINARAYTTFGMLAFAILLGMIGILEGNLIFWIGFTVIYIVALLYLSAEYYFMGNWNLDRGVFKRVYSSMTTDYQTSVVNVVKPVHTARMCVIILGNLMNWALAIWGVYKHETDFALYLLAIFMANTLLYFFFYIIMKVIYKERISKLSMLFLATSTLCAISAMYFFLHKSISWSKTPAESRTYNQECKLLQFYDYHDIWHFLSAVGMFFTFMVLLTLDDDLSHTLRSKIHVF